MKKFKLYNLWLSLLFIPAIFFLPVISLFIQPYYGDLTRLGGYREQSFGWRKTQVRYDPPLYEEVKKGGYQKYSDVVVLGDSFSMNMISSWPNHFVNATGFSLSVFLVDKYSVTELTNSSLFKENPPKIVIYESIERVLRKRLNKESKTCKIEQVPNFLYEPKNSLGVTPVTHRPPIGSGFLNYDLAFDYVKKALPRALLGINTTKTIKISLNRSGLFSSTNQKELLIAKSDVKRKRKWTDDTAKNIQCKLVEYQNRVQANGKTLFIIMIAPDKLTAYSDFIEDRSIVVHSKIDEIARLDGLNILRIDKALRKAIHDGIIDVYMPNDTHWSSVGHVIVSQELVNFIKTLSDKSHR